CEARRRAGQGGPTVATAQMDEVIRHVRRVTASGCEAKKDGDLLTAFVEKRDEQAFTALVRRHGPLVLGGCRRVVGNHHDAEDAFQAACPVLARRASSVCPREAVAGWLYGIARRTAMKARSLAARRQAREKQVTQMPEPEAAPDDPAGDLRPLLDQEL